MSIQDELGKALSDGLKAGATAARGQGAALRADFENLVKPQFDDIVAQLAGIAQNLLDGNIGPDQARAASQTQMDGIPPIIEAAAELAVLAVQVIVNAVIGALKSAINTAAKVPVF
jgi:hypothetical protein